MAAKKKAKKATKKSATKVAKRGKAPTPAKKQKPRAPAPGGAGSLVVYEESVVVTAERSDDDE